jgi:hypothetical protein
LQLGKLSEFAKFLRFSKNQADLRNIGAFQKIRRIYKILALYRKSGGFEKDWRLTEKQADDRILAALKSPRLVKNQRDWEILAASLLFRLGGISSC